MGTPQYVAPEVVTGFGEVDPTEKPYGKECDMWSMGVLLYVMLSKTMPFRAKEVDQLLKQVSPSPRVPPLPALTCLTAPNQAEQRTGHARSPQPPQRARSPQPPQRARSPQPPPRARVSPGGQGAFQLQARRALAPHLVRRARPHLEANRARPAETAQHRAGSKEPPLLAVCFRHVASFCRLLPSRHVASLSSRR